MTMIANCRYNYDTELNQVNITRPGLDLKSIILVQITKYCQNYDTEPYLPWHYKL